MNDAHFHLMLNHLPIVGVLIGFLALLGGYILKSPQGKITALGIFIFSALTAIAAFYTGKGAEAIVENMPGVSETLIHEHEEQAELFLRMVLLLGGTALLTLFFQFKKPLFAKYGFFLVLMLSISSLIISKSVGTSGGEITHIEIRGNSQVIKIDTGHDQDGN